MSRFHRTLRVQLLAAIGLSCKGGEPEAHTPVVIIAAPDPAPLASAPARPAAPKPSHPAGACPADHARETLCGRSRPPGASTPPAPYDGCYPTGDGIAAVGASRLFHPYSWKNAEYAHLRFDEASTRAYREPLTTQRGSAYSGANPMSAAPLCCYSGCTPLEVAAPPARPHADEIAAGRHCFPAPGEISSVPADGAANCPAGVVNARRRVEPFSGGESGAACCYEQTHPRPPPMEHRHNRGRPVTEDGVARIASPVPRGDWLDASPAERPTEPALGARWLRDAGVEHASVAAFSKLSLQLLALGAPADLLAGCHRAALDEIEHARMSYGMAASMLGCAQGPGPLVVDVHAVTVEQLVRETIRDGCVGETLATVEAFEAMERADGAEREVLGRIVEDETRHAALGFRILRWALETHGDAAREALDDELARLDAQQDGDATARAALAEIVRPCLRRVVEVAAAGSARA